MRTTQKIISEKNILSREFLTSVNNLADVLYIAMKAAEQNKKDPHTIKMIERMNEYVCDFIDDFSACLKQADKAIDILEIQQERGMAFFRKDEEKQKMFEQLSKFGKELNNIFNKINSNTVKTDSEAELLDGAREFKKRPMILLPVPAALAYVTYADFIRSFEKEVGMSRA